MQWDNYVYIIFYAIFMFFLSVRARKLRKKYKEIVTAAVITLVNLPPISIRRCTFAHLHSVSVISR